MRLLAPLTLAVSLSAAPNAQIYITAELETQQPTPPEPTNSPMSGLTEVHVREGVYSVPQVAQTTGLLTRIEDHLTGAGLDLAASGEVPGTDLDIPLIDDPADIVLDLALVQNVDGLIMGWMRVSLEQSCQIPREPTDDEPDPEPLTIRAVTWSQTSTIVAQDFEDLPQQTNRAALDQLTTQFLDAHLAANPTTVVTTQRRWYVEWIPFLN
jgi:hypothetical protein